MGKKWKSIFHMIYTPHRRYFFHKGVYINMQILAKFIQTSVSCVNIVLFKGKVGANFKVLRCPRSFKYRFHQDGKAWISIPGFLNQANRTSWSNFTACQNSPSEHSFECVPASLYKLTKSVPDPLVLPISGPQNDIWVFVFQMNNYPVSFFIICYKLPVIATLY